MPCSLHGDLLVFNLRRFQRSLSQSLEYLNRSLLDLLLSIA